MAAFFMQKSMLKIKKGPLKSDPKNIRGRLNELLFQYYYMQ